MATIPVDLNREQTHDVTVPENITVSGSFTLQLDNYGSPTHVHVNLDEDLSRVASLGDGNHFVDREATRDVFIDVVPPGEPLTGRLKVVTGHGKVTKYVSVTIEPGPSGKPPVDVDESLAKPQGATQSDESPDRAKRYETLLEENMPEGPRLVIGLVAAAAVVLALAVGLLLESTVVLIGTGIVVGAAIAVFVLS